MARITAIEVSKLTSPGRHFIEEGLYVQIRGTSRSWILRYSLNGKARWAGLGSARDVTLAEARKKRDDLRHKVRNGVDPVEEKRRQRAAPIHTGKTVREVAEDYLRAHEPAWRNAVHRRQWSSTLSTYVYPTIGNLAVDLVTVDHVCAILRPLWHSKPETARRVRGRMEAILSFAAAKKMRPSENPAQWKGHLEHLLPGRRKASVKHFAAMPFADVPNLMTALQKREGIAASALEFLILTAGRTGEVLGATFREIEGDVWTVPATRMKASKPHRVPLSSAACAVLDRMGEVSQGDLIFPGIRSGRPLSNMSLLAVLDRMGHGELTAHGFRSSFRDWAAEKTDFNRDVIEMALAHAIPSAVEAAYRRGDLFEKRRKLMDAWAAYCAQSTGQVVALHPVG
jgi:integrase